MGKYLTEFIGTFFLVFTIACSVIGGAALPPLAIGSALMVMIYAGGHVSGAHYNPAVTLAVLVRGRCSCLDAILYMFAQCIGAAGAALAAAFVLGDGKVLALEPKDLSAIIPQVLVCEGLFTFALAYVVLNVATSKDNANNSFYGLAIGFTVLAGAFSVGSISGGVFNPAVAVGISMLGMASWKFLWVYLAADFGGGLVAGIIFRVINPTDK